LGHCPTPPPPTPHPWPLTPLPPAALPGPPSAGRRTWLTTLPWPQCCSPPRAGGWPRCGAWRGTVAAAGERASFLIGLSSRLNVWSGSPALWGAMSTSVIRTSTCVVSTPELEPPPPPELEEAEQQPAATGPGSLHTDSSSGVCPWCLPGGGGEAPTNMTNLPGAASRYARAGRGG